MKKLNIIFISMLLSYNVYAEEKNITHNQDFVEIETSEYKFGIENIMSGLVFAASTSISENLNVLNAEERKNFLEFKKRINKKLHSDSLVQKIYFKTAEQTIDEKVAIYINNLVLSLDNYADLEYHLDGYADARGNEKYNLELSMERANSVRTLLLNIGIDEKNIFVNHYGEKDSLEKNNYEDYFFDRKVEIKIRKKK